MPTVVITGANRGIGLEFAKQYAAEGWRVVATVRQPDHADDLRAIPGVEVHGVDVADPAAIAAFGQTMAGQQVDVLINNAGVMGPAFPNQSKDGVDVDGWVQTMRVNTLAPILMTLVLRENLGKASRATVANLSSELGSIAGNRSGGMYAYRVSKAGLNMATKSLSVDLRDWNICFIVLHPGWVQTDMGGAQAPVQVTDSVTGMRKVIAGATMEHSGCFYTYEGHELEW